MSLLGELERRGMVQAVTSPDVENHISSRRSIYLGVDPSARSLHVGNLLALLGLLHFQLSGHDVVALIGGATGSIGDPSGRSTERRSLSSDELSSNIASITEQVHLFFSRAEEYAAKRELPASGRSKGRVLVRNNLEWFGGLGVLEFLRDVGKFARVGNMLSKDSVKARLSSSSGISFTEFSYQLLQAYDFSVLRSQNDVTVQLGGSDQWGNIVAGIELMRRKRAAETAAKGPQSSEAYSEADVEAEGGEDEAFGVTLPLLTTASGAKFGKSAGNAVWLHPGMTTYFDFYQASRFFLRTADADVGRYLRMLTLLPVEQVAEAEARHAEAPHLRHGQKLLASEVTELVHGPEGLSAALTATQVLFSTSLEDLKAQDVLHAFRDDPRLIHLPSQAVLDQSITKLAAEVGATRSRGEARKALTSGGLYLNNRAMKDANAVLRGEDLLDGRLAVLRIGKKEHRIIYVD